ncbi:MAG: hypothetical protein H0X66_01955 [Verrucomicrobia bacterium]|nr:hypothetical protein [Verrucomicrobiota bacterium]
MSVHCDQNGIAVQVHYGRSHGVGLPDAFLAATALAHNLQLATLNQKHFPMLNNIVVPYQKTAKN